MIFVYLYNISRLGMFFDNDDVCLLNLRWIILDYI